jgi:hypothetical protein
MTKCRDLSHATERLYEAFADVPKPAGIAACTHCITEDEISTLLEKPLRELSDEDLSAYASSAFLTAGAVEDYLYFLPRILELSATDDAWWANIEVTGRAIRNTEPHKWPEQRREALGGFFKAVIADLIEREEHGRIDDWMCAAGRAGIDVDPLLEVIETDRAAVLAYWEENAGKLDEGKLANEFWDLPNEEHDKIVRWFRSPKINLIYAAAHGYRTYK